MSIYIASVSVPVLVVNGVGIGAFYFTGEVNRIGVTAPAVDATYNNPEILDKNMKGVYGLPGVQTGDSVFLNVKALVIRDNFIRLSEAADGLYIFELVCEERGLRS